MLEALRSGRLALGPDDRPLRARARRAGRRALRRRGLERHGGAASLRPPRPVSGPGDEAITSPFSFVASANCILYEGATPVFADVDPVTLNLDPAAVEAAITPNGRRRSSPSTSSATRASSTSCASSPSEHGLALIEDACEALGAEYRGRPIGSYEHPAVFAFYPNKQVTTGRGWRDRRPLGGRSGGCSRASRTRAAPTRAAGSSMRASATTTASTTSPPRWGSPRSRSSTRSSPSARRPRPATASCSAGSTASSRSVADDAEHRRSWFVYPVRLPAAQRPRARHRAPGRERDRHRALPALDPPAAVHARAVRLPRGHAAGLGGGEPASARAAVLHRDRSRSAGASRRCPVRGARRRRGRIGRRARRRASPCDNPASWRTRPRWSSSGSASTSRSDRIYALEPITDERRGSRAPDARLGGGDRRADRGLAHRAHDPRRHGAARRDGLAARRPGGRSRRARRRPTPSAPARCCAARSRPRRASTSTSSPAARAACSRRPPLPGDAERLFEE